MPSRKSLLVQYRTSPLADRLGRRTFVRGYLKSRLPWGTPITSWDEWSAAVWDPNPVTGPPTARVEDFGIVAGAPGNRHWGAVTAPNGKVYAVPCSSPTGWVYDPITGRAYSTTWGLTFDTTAKWAGGCLGLDGKIYCAPYSANDVLVIDPATETAERKTWGLDLAAEGSAKYWGAVPGLNGKIYFVPNNGTKVLIVDPATDTAILSAMGASLTGTGKWRGGFLGKEGKIYCVPSSSTNLLVIDPIAGTATRSNLGATLPSTGTKWVGGVLGRGGNAYCVPATSTHFLRVNTGSPATASLVNLSGALTADTGKYACGVLAPDGRMWMGDGSNRDILVVNPTASTYERLFAGIRPARGAGIALAGDGKLILPPWEDESALIIDPKAGRWSTDILASPWSQHM